MEFDKSRVYTALNAEDLEVGSVCVFAQTLHDLQERVKNNDRVSKLKQVMPPEYTARFCSNDDTISVLAYFVASPSEPEYKPFSDVDEMLEVAYSHGSLIQNSDGKWFLVTKHTVRNTTKYPLHVAGLWINFDNLLRNYTFVDDGSPCGMLCE